MAIQMKVHWDEKGREKWNKIHHAGNAYRKIL